MLLVIEIAALVMGIIVLVKGEIKLTRRTFRRGPAVRVAGAILVLPLPLAFMVGVCYGMYLVAHGKQPDPTKTPIWFTLAEFGLALFCVVLACTIAAVFGDSRRPRRRRYEDDDLEWEDDEPRRRRRERFEEDFEDDDDYEEDRPRRRRRFEDDEDYEEERPRRRGRFEEDQ